MSSRGNFVVFEGIDGSGKSSQVTRVASERGALRAFEPGDTALGAQLRSWLLDRDTPMISETEALLMLADRSHHVHTVIEPALMKGRHVVCDRFTASTFAYQGYGRGVDLDALQRATRLAVGKVVPTLTVLMDLSVDLARSRRSLSEQDRFESSGVEFDEAVRQGYLELAHDNPAEWFIVDASGSFDEVSKAIDARLDQLEWTVSE